MDVMGANLNGGIILNAGLNILVGYLIIIAVVILRKIYIKNEKKIQNNSTIGDAEKYEKLNELNKKRKYLLIIVTLLSLVSIAVINLGSLLFIPAAKPIIYFYPEKEMEITVKLKMPEKLTCTYPKYIDEWNIIAKPNGDLFDLKTGRNLYALYWEGINSTKPNEDEGFVIKGEDTISFLEEKLEILGLSEREANEFIMYWLPQMEPNKYNFIRFETIEEINENMQLEISPTPDKIIRVMMEWKPLAKYKDVQEQKLTPQTREGFTVVEWGGSKIR